MKSLLSLHAFLLLSSVSFAQIEWAPEGAKWYYTFFNGFIPPYFTTETIEVWGDTVIAGQVCKKINSTRIENFTDLEFMYESDKKVYFFEDEINEFILLYDFSKQPGEYWSVVGSDTLRVHVDSIINYMGIKAFYVHFTDTENTQVASNGIIYEGIGFHLNMFYWDWLWNPPTVDLVYYGLRCYESPSTGLLKFIDEPCDSIPVVTGEIEKSPYLFTLQPNPTSADCTVKFQLPTVAPAEILLSDTYGRILQRHPLTAGSQSLPLDGLERGLYFVILKINGEVVRTEKLLHF